MTKFFEVVTNTTSGEQAVQFPVRLDVITDDKDSQSITVEGTPFLSSSHAHTYAKKMGFITLPKDFDYNKY